MGYLSSYFDNVSPVKYKILKPKNKIWRCITKQGKNVTLNEIDKKGHPKIKTIEKEYYDMHNQDWSYPEKRWPQKRILRVYNPTEKYCPINGYQDKNPGNGYVDIITLSKKPNKKSDSRVISVEAVKPDLSVSYFKLHLKKRGSKIIENNNSIKDLKQLIKGKFPETIKKYAKECLKLLKRSK